MFALLFYLATITAVVCAAIAAFATAIVSVVVVVTVDVISVVVVVVVDDAVIVFIYRINPFTSARLSCSSSSGKYEAIGLGFRSAD